MHKSIPTRPWYRHRWPWLLMLGPAIVLAAGGYTAYLAIRAPDALVASDYYKKGKAINQDLRRERMAQTMGLAMRLGFDAGSGRLRGTVTGRAAVRGPLTLRLAHATLPQQDLVLAVTPDANGGFSAPLPALARTRWQVTLEDQARTWRLGGEWTWPVQREVAFNA
jgi:hypothetical protein